MKKKIWRNLFLSFTLAAVFLTGSAAASAESETEPGTEVQTETETLVEAGEDTVLPDGVYTVEFDTDSSMFHINEALDGKAEMTVEDGEMTVHITLVSKNIENLYYGLAEDAQKEGAELIEPTVDTVTYEDGWTEEVYGFDLPVPALDEEFDVALIGTKGNWYDHKVMVSDPVPLEE